MARHMAAPRKSLQRQRSRLPVLHPSIPAMTAVTRLTVPRSVPGNRVVLVLALFLSVPALAAEVPAKAVRRGQVLHLQWEELRRVVSQGHFRPRVSVWGRSVVEGTLEGVTDQGILVGTRTGQGVRTGNELVRRDEFRYMRLVPARGNPRRWRKLALIGAVPLGVVSWLFGYAPFGGLPEGYKADAEGVIAIGTAVAVPYLVYRLARKADRGRGALFIVRKNERTD